MKRKRMLTKAMRGKKKIFRENIYANIDWEKAAVLFQQEVANDKHSHAFPPVKDILRVLAAAGAIGTIFVFPGAAIAFAPFVLRGRSYSPWKTKKVLSRLAKQKWVTIRETEGGKVTVTITKQGLRRALTYELDMMRLQKPKRWDKKWRVVVFDVPEKYKRLRDVFRIRLRQLGLYPLQESVFVSPYPCFNEVEFLRELYGVSFNVRYLVAESIEDDTLIRRQFDLS